MREARDVIAGVQSSVPAYRNAALGIADKTIAALDAAGYKIVRKDMAKIVGELYKAIEALGGSPDLLSIIGSYGDTLDDQEILDALVTYNATGKAMLEQQ